MALQWKRLEHSFAELAQFGALKGGGFSRVAFTPADLDARRWLQAEMQKAGLAVTVDSFGNMRGRREGKHPLPPVMLGSHLDTVPEGGNFDGAVGVLCALEVIRILNDRHIRTDRPIEVINFSAEESSRFGVATIGSKALTGRFDPAMLNTLTDREGRSLYQALDTAGYVSDDMEFETLSKGDIHAFLEIHIEQGPVLESQGCPVGIVTAIAASTRFKVRIEGRADHSGTTPMGMRKDALAGAAEIILGVERVASEEAGKKTVATVGYADVVPGAMNVVPGRVDLGIDIRDIRQQDKKAAADAIADLIARVGKERGLEVSCERLCDDLPVILSEKVIHCLEDKARELNFDSLMMTSGAGHDAMNMAAITDVGMIFIPSSGGISHNIAEFSTMEDIAAGAELLLLAALQLAQE